MSAGSLLDYLARGEGPGLSTRSTGCGAAVCEHERRRGRFREVALKTHRWNVRSVLFLLLFFGLLRLRLDQPVADEVVEEGVVLLVDRLFVLGGDKVEDCSGPSLLAVGGCRGSK